MRTQAASAIERIRRNREMLVDDLDERARRRWAGAASPDLNRGGITTGSRATGLSRGTVRAGVGETSTPESVAHRYRPRSGGGRRPDTETQPGLRAALDALFEPAARGCLLLATGPVESLQVAGQ